MTRFHDREIRSQDDVTGYSAQPILIHVGLHKTATTWLKHQVLDPKHGKELVYCSDFEATHRAFLRPGYGQFSVAATLDLLAPYLRQAEEGSLPLVLSDEALCGLPFLRAYFREIAAHRMANAFPKAKILVTIREQCSVIDSMYGEYLKFGMSSPVQDFIAPSPEEHLHPILDMDYYRYDLLYDFYSAVFGAENVLFYPMEKLTQAPDAALAEIFDWFGHPISPPDKELAQVPRNEAWTGIGRAVLRRANQFFPYDNGAYRRARLTPIKQKLTAASLASRVDRWAKACGVPRSKKHRQIIDREIGDFYAESNARFSRLTGIDLASLGYPTQK